jgi:hypothetical protein
VCVRVEQPVRRHSRNGHLSLNVRVGFTGSVTCAAILRPMTRTAKTPQKTARSLLMLNFSPASGGTINSILSYPLKIFVTSNNLSWWLALDSVSFSIECAKLFLILRTT